VIHTRFVFTAASSNSPCGEISKRSNAAYASARVADIQIVRRSAFTRPCGNFFEHVAFNVNPTVLPPFSELTFTHKSDSFVLPEDPIHLSDFVQGKKATPHDGWSGWTVMLATQVSAEPRDPQHDLSQ
jgi:hypothetical protein